MVKVPLDAVRAANDTFSRDGPLNVVVTGGTSGIGEYTIRTLAAHYQQSQQPLRVYIVGRNADSAARIVAECHDIYPAGDFRFVQASDLSLISNADHACSEINKQQHDAESKDGRPACIDLLVMTHADLHWGGRRETKEGLDKTFSLLYYSRMRIAMNLLPLLQATNRPSHVISVFGAGLEKVKYWKPHDMSLKQLEDCNLTRIRSHTGIMAALFMEKLARDNAGKVAFAHVFPGLVITPAFYSPTHPLWFKITWALLRPLAELVYCTPSAECGERMMFLATANFPPHATGETAADAGNTSSWTNLSTNGIRGGGAYSCNSVSDVNDVQNIYKSFRKQGTDRLVVEHTLQVFREIESTGAYKG